MRGFQQVIVVGNVTRDIDLKNLGQNGTPYCQVGVAVNESVKVNNEWKDMTTYVDVDVWGKTAENASKYLGKGSPVQFIGRLKLDSWEKDGKKQYKLKVVCERMLLLGDNRNGNGGGGGGSGSQQDGPP